MDLTKKRWFFLGLFCLINFCSGSLYVWSVFAMPIAERLSQQTGVLIGAADIGIVFSIAGSLTPLTMIVGGYANDRYGPVAVISIGGLAIAAGYLLTATASSIAMLIWSYGLLIGLGMGFVNGCTINNAVKFFPDRRGFASGTVTACFGIGSAVLPIVANELNSTLGITLSLQLFGIVSGILIVGCALLTQKCPDRFEPLGGSNVCATPRLVVLDKSPLQMIRTATFYPLICLFMGAASAGLMLISSAASIAQTQIGMTSAAAALAVSILSLANTTGRFVCGTLSDRFGRITTLIMALFCAMLGLFCLSHAGIGDKMLFYVGLVGVGLCFGSFVSIYPSIAADEYGSRYNSVNFAVLALGYSAGGLIGPQLLKVAASSGNYSLAYWLAGIIVVCALFFALLFLWIKKRTPPCTASTPPGVAL